MKNFGKFWTRGEKFGEVEKWVSKSEKNGKFCEILAKFWVKILIFKTFSHKILKWSRGILKSFGDVVGRFWWRLATV